MNNELILKGELAKKAAYVLAAMDTATKNAALTSIADALVDRADYILEQNELDTNAAKERGISASLLDRLTLTQARIEGMAQGIMEVVALPDPIGEIIHTAKRPNGLLIGKTRTPLGVIGIIYEARPNVTSDAAVLCLKAGNTVILRGGSEAINSNKAIVSVMQEAADKSGMPKGIINLVEDTSRETATQLMKLNEYINVLIPRGGTGLIKSVVDNATVPIIETGSGNCHIYVEKTGDFDMARKIIVNAKTSRPSVCNAAEKLLVDREIAERLLPLVAGDLKEFNVELRCDSDAITYCEGGIPATEDDWRTEYGDFIIGIKVVNGISEAIEHINTYSTKHSEAIITADYSMAMRFHREIDSAAVYVNASTRFTDGQEFGLGAEIGISTQKMHARGPMGLNELTSVKYLIYGEGQIR